MSSIGVGSLCLCRDGVTYTGLCFGSLVYVLCGMSMVFPFFLKIFIGLVYYPLSFYSSLSRNLYLCFCDRDVFRSHRTMMVS